MIHAWLLLLSHKALARIRGAPLRGLVLLYHSVPEILCLQCRPQILHQYVLHRQMLFLDLVLESHLIEQHYILLHST